MNKITDRFIVEGVIRYDSDILDRQKICEAIRSAINDIAVCTFVAGRTSIRVSDADNSLTKLAEDIDNKRILRE